VACAWLTPDEKDTPDIEGPYNQRVVDATTRDRLMAALWPTHVQRTSSVWAILDGARDERIFPALRGSRLDYLCLYSGHLPEPVKLAAPYLIELAPDYQFTPKLLELGWGQSWGVFVRTDDPLNLRHHLRRFLRVQDESGRRLLFRYYDPRVLRVYLPTCRRDELEYVFGPVRSYLIEDLDGRALMEFTFDGERLHERRTTLSGTES
jgi:hypothetical protein